MYRFLATPKWIAVAALPVVLAAVRVALGFWQLHRYHERSANNARIDAAVAAPPVAIGEVLAGDRPPASGSAWTRVKVTGRYDPAHEIIARERTVNSQVGFEILDPLRLSDGTAVLVDRGWLAAPVTRGAVAMPRVPAVPSGEVTVTGLVHLPESRADTPTRSDNGQLTVRRISPARLASAVPYPLLGGYLALASLETAEHPDAPISPAV